MSWELVGLHIFCLMIVDSSVGKLFSLILFCVDGTNEAEESEVSCGLWMLHSGSEIQLQLDIFLWVSIDISTLCYTWISECKRKVYIVKFYLCQHVYSQNATPYTFIHNMYKCFFVTGVSIGFPLCKYLKIDFSKHVFFVIALQSITVKNPSLCTLWIKR